MPTSYLARKLSSGVVGGLQHAYALTTHAAQGETFAVATPLVTDTSSAEGVYVGITRGQFDLQGVVIRHRDLVAPLTDDDFPVLREETTVLAATERHLEQSSSAQLASEFPRVHRRDDSVSAESNRDPHHHLRDSHQYARCNDNDLVELQRAIERDLRQARADISRLEADLTRRQAINESVSDARYERSALLDITTSVCRRLEILAAGIGERTLALRDIGEEFESRGIPLELEHRADRPLSTPNAEELHVAQMSVTIAATPPVSARVATSGC